MVLDRGKFYLMLSDESIRVPPGYDYEVVTHVKKYADQSRAVDSKQDVQQRLSIKLEPRGKGQTGAKS